MRVTSFVAAVAPHTGKIVCITNFVKNGHVFLKVEQICYKMAYYTLYLDSVNRQKSSCKVKI